MSQCAASGGAHPLAQPLAFPEGRTKARVAECRAALERSQSDSALDGREFERKGGDAVRQPGERLRLEPLDVELDEGWHAVPADQFVERRDGDWKRLWPRLRLPSLGAAAGVDEIPRQRGRRGIVEIDHHRCTARHPPDCGRYQGDGVVASEQNRQRPKQGGLRLHGNDPGAKPAEGANSVTDVGADIEDKIARLDESRIERIHRAGAS